MSTSVDAARIRARYPRSLMRSPLGLALILVLAALLLGWTLWAGMRSATKPVSAQVHSFHATSDTQVDVLIDVQRADTARGATCTVIAAGTNGVPVGEATATVAAGGTTMTSPSITIRTTGRALSAKIDTCQVA